MFLAFTSPVPLLRGTSPRTSTCSVRRRAPRAATEGEWDTPIEWETAGRGIPSKGLQEIEFIIRQDGRIEEKVTGVRGKDCIKLTEQIHKALGRVTHTEKTEEYFEEVYETIKENQVIKDVVPPDDSLFVQDPNVPSW